MKNTPLAIALALLAVSPALADSTLSPAPPRALHHQVRHTRRQAAVAPLTTQTLVPKPVRADNTAPVPNEWVTAPIDRSDQDTSVAPAVMQIHYPPMGDGYTTGSSAQAMDDREAAKVTGVQVRVPLGQ